MTRTTPWWVVLSSVYIVACGGRSSAHDDTPALAGGNGAGTSQVPRTPSIDLDTVAGCDYAPIFKKCSSVGCHNVASMQSGLVLTPDADLPARLKDVPAKFRGIDCAAPNHVYMECTTVPAACPVGALLVDSSSWQDSYLLTTLGPATGCGDAMPFTYTLSDAEEACIETVVRLIAEAPWE